MQLLEDFQFNDPEFWQDDELIDARARLDEEIKSPLDSEESVVDSARLRKEQRLLREKAIEEADRMMD